MIEQLLYLVGAPGVGKSTVARELTHHWDKSVVPTGPVPHVLLKHPGSGRLLGLELGVPRESFPGTDALAMDIGPRALTWLGSACCPFVLGEGARLATRPFLGGMARSGVRVTLVRLAAGEELLTERWRARGSKQSPSWRKGAGTRAERITDWFRERTGRETGFDRLVEIDVTDLNPADTADMVRAVFPLIDPRELQP